MSSSFHQLMVDHTAAQYTDSPIPTAGPAAELDGPRSFAFVPSLEFHLIAPNPAHPAPPVQDPASPTLIEGGPSTGVGANHYPSSAAGVPRLPPILQVEKQQVTTSATQLASASRRRNEANFACPVPGCGSTFTRRPSPIPYGRKTIHTALAAEPRIQPLDDIKLYTRINPSLMSVKDARRLLVDWTRSMFVFLYLLGQSLLHAIQRHLRSDGAAECRQKHASNLAPHASVPSPAQGPSGLSGPLGPP
ncbi:hypothetical protein D9757_000748 [Collybiopsis confluens]|uniref:C2H2-type domain-containing protein n=1 Tax=Collybiopsis confluens TaxID=2823264 RepID=A0A8H5MG63_9AGAR|nr:hypothetical protein D9757_000748 [Collybiopsis confluens]